MKTTSGSCRWFNRVRNLVVQKVFTRASPELVRKLPSSVFSLPSDLQRTALWPNCHLHTDFERDREKTRAEKHERWWWFGGERREMRGEGVRRRKSNLREYTCSYMLFGKLLRVARRVFFCGGLHGKRATDQGKRLLLLENATCGDNSIVHFIRSAALRYKHAHPLSWNSAGIKGRQEAAGNGRGEGGKFCMCLGEDY